MSRVEVKRGYEYAGWKNNVRLANGVVELIATADVGPRIIHFGFLGKANELYQHRADLGQTGGNTWRAYGGHRLWHAPEAMPRSYAPDNEPVEVNFRDGWLQLEAETEVSTGIAKTLEIHLHEERAELHVLHRLTNRGLWPVTLSAWALTVVA